MLTTSILFSTYRPAVIPSNLPNKDINIFEHTLEPVPKLNLSYKKSSTNPNSLAVSATHIFAVQADKALVQVYNRDKGTKEVDVPFGEKIASCCFVESKNRDGVGILVLGMEGGRLILWEICTGRQISTPPAHLEAVTCLAVDSTRNFLLSGSKDHNVHVWKLTNLLSFSTDSRTPYKTLLDHRGSITSLVVSHGQMHDTFALSASEDKTVLMWNIRNATRIATFLSTSIPRVLTIDPADRAFYVGSSDGIQFVDLNGISPSDAQEAIELGENFKWTNESNLLCLAVDSDGTHLLTGHENGKVFRRTTPKGQPSLVYDAHLPVSNVVALSPTGFPYHESPVTKPSIVKPRLEMAVQNDDALIPDRYEFHATFTSFLPSCGAYEKIFDDFDAILEHPSFPDELLSLPLTTTSKNKGPDMDEETLKELESFKQANSVAKAQVENLTAEVERLRQAEVARLQSKKLRRIKRNKAMEMMRKKAMGEETEAMDIEEDVELNGASSDSDD